MLECPKILPSESVSKLYITCEGIVCLELNLESGQTSHCHKVPLSCVIYRSD
jgi:hypothetical protein